MPYDKQLYKQDDSIDMNVVQMLLGLSNFVEM